MTETKKVFTRREEIMEYLGISEYIYVKFIRLGMPVLYLDGRCYAHRDNIDLFFKSITATSAKNSPEGKITGEEKTVEGDPQNNTQNGGSKK